MRRSSIYLVITGVLILTFAAALLHAMSARSALGPGIARTRWLAADLELTDLALFNEARYTRHPSQADLHSAFQEHPLSLEHFPTGSLVAPPEVVRR